MPDGGAQLVSRHVRVCGSNHRTVFLDSREVATDFWLNLFSCPPTLPPQSIWKSSYENRNPNGKLSPAGHPWRDDNAGTCVQVILMDLPSGWTGAGPVAIISVHGPSYREPATMFLEQLLINILMLFLFLKISLQLSCNPQMVSLSR